MKQLFLIRHAKSSWADPGLADHDRPLADKGRRQLELMREIVRAAGALEVPVFCSTAVRARQTLQGLLEDRAPAPVEFDPGLYTFDFRDLLRWLGQRQEDALTMVGHNPAFEDLADRLLIESRGHLSTCGFVHIELPIDDWRRVDGQRGALRQWVTPKTVRG